MKVLQKVAGLIKSKQTKQCLWSRPSCNYGPLSHIPIMIYTFNLAMLEPNSSIIFNYKNYNLFSLFIWISYGKLLERGQ
jgi:hypothetical protein